MKAAIVHGPGRLELVDMDVPGMGPYDCLVKIDACATCTGTDLSIIDGSFAFLQPYPVAIGHESTGLVVEVGERVRHFSPGQRVTRPACILAGQAVGGVTSNWGGFAEYGLVHDGVAEAEDGGEGGGMTGISRVPLPDDVDAVSASLSINQREILSVVKRMELDAGARFAVVGSGYNGLLFAFFARHFGAGQVVMLGSAARAGLGLAGFGADAFFDYRDPGAPEAALAELDGGPTHVVDAVGSRASVALCRKLLGPGTAFGCYGVHEHAAIQPAVEEIAKDHLAPQMWTDEPGTVSDWHAMWKAGAFAFEGMVGGIMPFSETVAAFGRIERREAVKLVLVM
jgi:threonine dehydrogenase-like Zn-dependent dehydrogenase